MSAKLKIKRGTTTSWADSANKDTTLEPGQLGVEYLTDGNMRLKVGKQTDDGSATDWSGLPYVTPPTSVYQDDHIELYSGYKTLSINADGDVLNPGTYGTIHLGDPNSPYHNIRLNGDSEVVLSAPTTIVQGDLSVMPQTGVELKVSAGGYLGSPKLSSSGDESNSFLQIANLVSDSAADGTNRGIEFVSSFKTTSTSTCSLRWDFSSLAPKLYSTSNPCYLGSSSNPWSNVYTAAVSDTPSLSAGTSSGGTSSRVMTISCDPSITYSSGTYGTVNSKITLQTRKTIKSSASESPSSYQGSLSVYFDGDDTEDKVVIENEDPGSALSTENSTNTLVIKSSGDTKDSSYCGYSRIQLMCTNYGGATRYDPAVNIDGQYDDASSLCELHVYPYNTSSSGYLGTSSNPWYRVNSTYTTTSFLSLLNGPGIRCTTNLLPGGNSTSDSTGYTLGSSSYKWRSVYAYSGTIQTSDRSAKDSIHYITESNNDSSVMSASVMSLSEPGLMDSPSTTSQYTESNASLITVEDVIDFVSNLSPVTFCYKDGQGDDVEATEENSDPESIQLGLIADDIKDHKLFKYVGVETTYEEEITPAVKDEEGNVITEAVTETKTTLGLQAIPLATAALTACKYLIQKNEEIELRLADIEDQLSRITSN